MNSFDYTTPKNPVLCLSILKVENCVGRPPIPRIQPASCVIKNKAGEPLLVIYGGRNDTIFAGVNNIALNDINLLNLITRQWCQVSLYGLHPCSRWAHTIVPNRESYPSGVYVFGGVNLTNYCRSKLYQLDILHFAEPRSKTNEEEITDFKIFANLGSKMNNQESEDSEDEDISPTTKSFLSTPYHKSKADLMADDI